MVQVRQGARALFVFAAILMSLYLCQRYLDGNPPVDFRVFWDAARADDPYRQITMPFVYPPPSLILFKPIGWLSFVPSYWLWFSVSVALFLCAARRLGLIALASGAAIQGLVLGQSAMLLGSGILLAFTLPALWGGAVLGIIASIKPQLVFMAPLALLVRRDWQMVKGAALGFCGMVLASLFLFGPSLWADWWAAFSDLQRSVPRWGAMLSMVTPAGRAYGLGLPELPALIAGFVIGGSAIILSARHVERESLAALVIAASIVSSPYAHLHDIIGIIPACVALMVSGPIFPAIIGAIIFVGGVAKMPYALLALLIWFAVKSLAPLRTRSDHQSEASGLLPA